MLTAARDYYRDAALVARRAAQRNRELRTDRERASNLRVHQIAAAQLSSSAFPAMLNEQDIDTAARDLLNSTAFTTQTESFLAMLDATESSGDIDRLVASLVQDAGRAADSVNVAIRNEIGFVRYLNPPSCSRCAVLAGRVYRYSTGFLRHPGCDCVMTPVSLGDKTLVQDPVELMKRGLVTGLSKADRAAILDGADFNKVVNSHRRGLTAPGSSIRRKGSPTIEQVLASADGQDDARSGLRNLGFTTARRSASAAGNGRGGGPPAKTSSAQSPEPDDRAARQAALGIETNGERLEDHEIVFVERMQALGHQLEWLARGRPRPDGSGRPPTNDFIWLNNGGLRTEVKTIFGRTASYRKLRTKIYDAVVDAAAQGVTKENFVIDLGEKALSQQLRRQLADYNRLRESAEGRIRRLWVMTRGELVEIALN